MTERRWTWTPWLVFVSSATMMAAAIFLAYSRGELAQRGSDLGFGVVSLSFPLVGAVIASQRRRNAIGWLLLGIGFLGVTIALGDELVMHAEATGTGSALAPYSAWISESIGNYVTPLLVALVFLFFPNGRLPSPRWRWLVRFGVVGAVVGVVGSGLLPGRYEYFVVDNPLGVEGWRRPLEVLRGLSEASLLVYMPMSVLSLFVRRRTAGAIERQQLKWLALAAAVMVVVMGFGAAMEATGAAGAGTEDGSSDWAALALFGTALVSVAGAIGVAVLRYRLFDIDLVVRRTIVYTMLTGSLAVLYVGAVALTRAVLPVGSGDVAVAASTLAVAALFAPLRRRIQSFIDQTFYRHRYDARRTVEEFIAHLRDEVDLATVTAELEKTARKTMQPAALGVWLARREDFR